jgi:hypothetical protein
MAEPILEFGGREHSGRFMMLRELEIGRDFV